MCYLQDFRWLLNLKNSALNPTQRLEYLGLIPGKGQGVPLLAVKLRKLGTAVQLLLNCNLTSLQSCMQALGLMVSTF